MNVSYDTNLLLSGSSVRSMKMSLGTKVPARKDKNGRFYYLNCKKVDRHTRSGFNGREIICPMCDHVSTVYHFSWSSLVCQHCELEIPKRSWWTLK
jgi:ribosomal protein S27E